MSINDLIKNNEYTVILCLGDSLTEANHCIEGYPGYVVLRDEALRLVYGRGKFLVINAGIGGRKICDSIPFLKDLINRFKPAITTVMFGMNDCVKGLDGLDLFTSSVHELLDFLHSNNSSVILLTRNPITAATLIQSAAVRTSPLTWTRCGNAATV